MRFVTFNGPIGCGKSWVCNSLQAIHGDQAVFRRESFQDALREATYATLGLGMETRYDEFKVTHYVGFTGRQWMIDIATRARENDQYVWSRTLINRCKRRYGDKDIILVDSNGFPDELEFLRVQPGIDVLTCSIELPDGVERGAQFPGDSRFNLAHMCSIVKPNSSEMLPAVVAALKRRGWMR